MAERAHVALVLRGRKATARWRRRNRVAVLNLAGADLGERELVGVNLSGADLHGAHLELADLASADLRRADLTGALLSQANLRGADLSEANLTEADLSGADLSGACFDATDLSKAKFATTYLLGVDLSRAANLAYTVHSTPSKVDVDTLITSLRSTGTKLSTDLVTFFQAAGVPMALLEALPTIVAEVKHYTCFISYGEPDRSMATRVYDDLKARGLSCWLYAMDATVGQRIWREIGQKRREAERMVVLCSRDALVRDGVLKELEEQIDEDPEKIVPVSLDDGWKEPGFRVSRGNRDLKPFLLERTHADLRDTSYPAAISRLLKGLERVDSSPLMLDTNHSR